MAGNRGAIHKGALMKMLQVSAQTLPLWVGELNGSKPPPPLCGAVPADPNYIAKVNAFNIFFYNSIIFHIFFYTSNGKCIYTHPGILGLGGGTPLIPLPWTFHESNSRVIEGIIRGASYLV